MPNLGVAVALPCLINPLAVVPDPVASRTFLRYQSIDFLASPACLTILSITAIVLFILVYRL